VEVAVRVTNTGPVAGAEVVQVYVRDPKASVLRPPRELKAFRKVRLSPGSSETLTFTLTARDLSFWHPTLRRWVVEGGTFVIEVGASSRDIRVTATVEVAGESAALPLDSMSTVAEWLAHPVGGPLLRGAMAAAGVPETDDEMLRQIPLEVALSFAGGAVPPEDLANLVAAANA
jgi:beta-glucosidase